MTSEQDSSDRYEHILKRIAESRPFGGRGREILPQTPHERALDRINAFDSMSALRRQDYDRWLCYGPKSVAGSAWAGVVVWAHHKGYHGYQNLTLMGAWAHYALDEIQISIGSRLLPYGAPVYDAGVYRVAIRSNFRIYYDDTGRPPEDSDSLLYRQAYTDGQRLLHRQELNEVVKQWQGKLAAD